VIRVHRPAQEPEKLQRQRAGHLPRTVAAFNQHGATSDALKQTLKHYDGGREALFKAQHKKCAYCERRAPLSGNSLEHFRPKSEATRSLRGERPVLEETGYWWLTWTWSNHLFACTSCNTGLKGTYFPLGVGSSRLSGPPAGQATLPLDPAFEDVTAEAALLIDPAIENPLAHLAWKPVDPNTPRALWKWTVSPQTERGRVTILVLGLLSHAADIVGPHLRDNVLDRADAVCSLVDAGDFPAARDAWTALLARVTRPDCDLAGPTWSALHVLVDADRRLRASLELPPAPGTRSPEPTTPAPSG